MCAYVYIYMCVCIYVYIYIYVANMYMQTYSPSLGRQVGFSGWLTPGGLRGWAYHFSDIFGLILSVSGIFGCGLAWRLDLFALIFAWVLEANWLWAHYSVNRVFTYNSFHDLMFLSFDFTIPLYQFRPRYVIASQFLQAICYMIDLTYFWRLVTRFRFLTHGYTHTPISIYIYIIKPHGYTASDQRGQAMLRCWSCTVCLLGYFNWSFNCLLFFRIFEWRAM